MTNLFCVDHQSSRKEEKRSRRRTGVEREGRGKGIGSFHMSKASAHESDKNIIAHLKKDSRFQFEMKFPMWAMSVKDFISRYDRKGAILDSHDVLKDEGLLQKMPVGEQKHVIFISHEWYSIHHPDPDGIKLGHLCSMLRRFINGEITEVST